MTVHNELEDRQHSFDFQSDENPEELLRKKHIRQMIESRLERKKLKEELEDYEGELDDEFDWDKID